MTSDYVLKREGYEEVVTRLRRGGRRVVIVGGSHSGFSVAGMLLHGPCVFNHNQGKLMFKEFPGAPRKSCRLKTACCICGAKSSGKKEPCLCSCTCYGQFSNDVWRYSAGHRLTFSDGDITILYRDRVKVFYSKVRLALADGYTDFDRRVYSKMDGYLYSFTGLRGDAKSLYKKVVAGTERRVKLVQAPTWEDQ